jgi:hypothetical protein
VLAVGTVYLVGRKYQFNPDRQTSPTVSGDAGRFPTGRSTAVRKTCARTVGVDGWTRRARTTRAVEVTEEGFIGLREVFGVELET